MILLYLFFLVKISYFRYHFQDEYMKLIQIMNLIRKDDEYDKKENFELNVDLRHVQNYCKNLKVILDKIQEKEEINFVFHSNLIEFHLVYHLLDERLQVYLDKKLYNLNLSLMDYQELMRLYNYSLLELLLNFQHQIVNENMILFNQMNTI